LILNALGEESKTLSVLIGGLLRHLWQDGWSTACFDYPGAGDSEGSLSDLTLEDWIASAEGALAYAHAAVRPSAIALVGVRLGANLCAPLVLRVDTRRLIGVALWAPILDMRRYERQVRWTTQAGSGNGGIMDYRGWPIAPEFLAGMHSLPPLCNVRFPCPVFLAVLSPSRRLPGIVARTAGPPSQYDRVVVVTSKSLWLSLDRVDDLALTRETQDWLSSLEACSG
jgi:hypothetical protein